MTAKQQNEEHDPYSLYVRSYRTWCMTWLGPEPNDAVGQLAIALGKKDAATGGHGLRTRAQFEEEIAKFNADPPKSHRGIAGFFSRFRPRRYSFDWRRTVR